MAKQFLIPLLRYALSENIIEGSIRIKEGQAISEKLSRLSLEEWRKLYALSCKQGIPAIVYSAVNEIYDTKKIPEEIKGEWYLLTRWIEKENKRLNKACSNIFKILKNDNIKGCILKGQGCATMYPRPLCRQTGDIDLWMEGTPEEVCDYVKSHMPNVSEEGYLHISSELKSNIHLEIHYRPAMLNEPFANARLQNWFRQQAPRQWKNFVELPDGEGMIAVPTSAFNCTFLLMHFLHHYVFEGTGFKSFLDIFLAFRNLNEPFQDKANVIPKGLLKAISWIFKELGMPEEKLPATPDETLGRKMLEDILATGIVSAEELAKGKIAHMSATQKACQRFKRSLRLLHIAPSELIWVLIRQMPLLPRIIDYINNHLN